MVKRLTTKEFIKRSKKKHGGRYDYSSVDYVNKRTKVIIICKEHGEFYQLAGKYIGGRGCPECNKNYFRKTTNKYLQEAKLVHGNKYDYLLVNYINNKTKIKIICKIHGEFEQNPKSHLIGHGCKRCGFVTTKSKISKDLDWFVGEAEAIHGNVYDYSLVLYKNNRNKVKIICNKHGNFNQSPSDHLMGKGCPKCSNNISKIERLYFYKLNNPNIIRNKRLEINGKQFVPDGYDTITKTIYEFNGDYWHGNPKVYDKSFINKNNKKTMGELYRKTLKKEAEYKSAGYKVVSVWESDFIKSIGKSNILEEMKKLNNSLNSS